MTELSMYLLLALLAFLLLIWVITPGRSSAPGPFQWPLLGCGLELLKRRPDLLDYTVELFEKFGDTVQIWGGFNMPRMVLTRDPKVVQYVMKDNFDNYVKGADFREKFGEVLGAGIFTSDGQEWYVQRKTSAHMFNVGSFKNHMQAVFQRNGQGVVELISQAAASGQQFDMQNFMFRFTLDSVGEIAFGVQIGAMADANNIVAASFDKAQSVSESRFFEPAWKLKKLLGHTDERALAKGVTILDKFCNDIIANRKKETAEQLNQRGDLLSRFMELRTKEGKPVCSDSVLRDVIMNFLIAGRDTTANAMSWAFYMLCNNPRVMTKLLAELETVDLDPTYDQIKNATYLHHVITETLRLYPSVPKDGKFSINADTLPDGTKVPGGCLVGFVPYAMGRDKKLWGDDCLEFRPERHDGDLNPNQYKFTAFNAGPRRCLGVNMAYYEAGTVLAMLLKRFKFAVRPGYKAVPLTTVTCPIDGGLPMTATAI